MAYYNRDDLESVLHYLADEFGAGVFTGHGRGTGREDIIDLLPYFFSTALHKGEYHLMKIMALEGVLQAVESLKQSNPKDIDQRRKLHKLHMEILKLTEYFIPEETAAKYVYMVAEAMGLEVPAIEPIKVNAVKTPGPLPNNIELEAPEPAPAEINAVRTSDNMTHQTEEESNPYILDEQKTAQKLKEMAKEFFHLCELADASVVEEELAKGMNVNARGPYNRTALYTAIQKGRTDIVKVLLEHGAEVNVRDINGKTPLHFAARGWREEIVKILLSHGAEVRAVDDYGRTPFDEALRYRHPDIAELLRA